MEEKNEPIVGGDQVFAETMVGVCEEGSSMVWKLNSTRLSSIDQLQFREKLFASYSDHQANLAAIWCRSHLKISPATGQIEMR